MVFSIPILVCSSKGRLSLVDLRSTISCFQAVCSSEQLSSRCSGVSLFPQLHVSKSEWLSRYRQDLKYPWPNLSQYKELASTLLVPGGICILEASFHGYFLVQVARLVFGFLLYSSSIVFHSNWRLCLNLSPSRAKLSLLEVGLSVVASFANLLANPFPTTIQLFQE